MQAKDFSVVEICYTLSSDIGGTRNGVDLFSIKISVDKDGVIATRLWKLGDEVNDYFFPSPIGNIKQLCYGRGVT